MGYRTTQFTNGVLTESTNNAVTLLQHRSPEDQNYFTITCNKIQIQSVTEVAGGSMN